MSIRKINKIKVWLFFTLLFLNVVLFSKVTFAETEKLFTINPVIDQTQPIPSTSLFSFPLKNGESVEKQVEVKNLGTEPMTLRLKVESAVTTLSGVVYRVEPNQGIDERYRLEDYVTLEEDLINLQAGESKRVTFKVQLPAGENQYEEILGGIGASYVPENRADEAVNAKTNVDIVVPVHIINSEIAEKEQLIFENFFFEKNHSIQTPFSFTIRNGQGIIRKGEEVSYQLIAPDKQVLLEKTMTPFEMAPMTDVTVAIPFSNAKDLKTGLYKLVITSDEGRQKDTLYLEVTAEAVKEYKKINGASKSLAWWIWLLILLLLLIIAGLIWYIRSLKRKKIDD